MKEIRTVSVIGANGTMGCYAAAIFASFGKAKVNLVCRRCEDAIKAVERAKQSVKADAIEPYLIAKTYEDLPDILPETDLVFESVFEGMDTKRAVYAQIVPYIHDDTIIATNTSGLSINALSECFDEDIRKHFLGIHFFNPPYSLTLGEVIPSKYTDTDLVHEIEAYLASVLRRTVVEVKDVPAFMGNRVGFQFINEAMQYAEKYQDQGGIDYIDAILGPYTGRSMSPLTTADFVGLDVHKAIVDNVYENSSDYAHDTFILPAFAQKLIAENKLGRKSGIGLYQMVADEDGKKTLHVYDIKTDSYRPKKTYKLDFADEMVNEFKEGRYRDAFDCLANNDTPEAALCREFLIKYAIYGIASAKEFGDNIHAADGVMASGFNWVPPLAVVDAFGGADRFKQIAKRTLPEDYLSLVNIDDVLDGIPESRYNYRMFFKARR